MSGIKVRGSDFVLYWVSDMERSLRFYRDLLGMEVGDNWGNEWVELSAPPTTLALCRAGADGSAEGVTIGGHAPALFLAVEDLGAAMAEVKRRDIPVRQEPEDGAGCISAAILDPDGNVVGLHQRKDGTFG
jgi:catechol 2,3-dioxygenase-like lactoylglutathione lyase family enzyme